MEYIAEFKDNGVKEFTSVIEKQAEALQQSLSFLERKFGLLYSVNVTTITNPELKEMEVKECGNPIDKIRKECQGLVDLVKSSPERSEGDEMCHIYAIVHSAIYETLGRDAAIWLEKQGVRLA